MATNLSQCQTKHSTVVRNTFRYRDSPKRQTKMHMSWEQEANVNSSFQSTSSAAAVWNANCCLLFPLFVSQMMAEGGMTSRGGGVTSKFTLKQRNKIRKGNATFGNIENHTQMARTRCRLGDRAPRAGGGGIQSFHP